MKIIRFCSILIACVLATPIKFPTEFEKRRLTLKGVKQMSETTLTSHLKSSSLMSTATKVLEQLLGKLPPKANKAFLSAYMAVSHPDTMNGMEYRKEEFESVISAAEELIKEFEKYFDEPQSSNSFEDKWDCYYGQFIHWIEGDKINYLQELRSSILDLNNLWQAVKNQEDALTEWKPRIDSQRERLVTEFKSLGGREEDLDPLSVDFLTHQIVLDQELKLAESKVTLLENEYISSLEPLQVFKEIKSRLMEVVVDKKVKEIIDLNLDLQWMSKQQEKSALDFEEKIEFIVSTMRQHCAPVRDPEFNELNVDGMTLQKCFQIILDILTRLKFDLTNFQLNVIRPTLESTLVEKERSTFKFTDSLPPITKNWFQQVFENDMNHNENRNENIFAQAMVEAIYHGKIELETFRYDHQRVVELRNALEQNIFIGKIIALVRSFWTVDFVKLNSLADDLESVVAISMPVDEFQEQIISKIKGITFVNESQEIMFKKMLSKSDSVGAIMRRRLLSVVKGYLITGKLKDISKVGLFLPKSFIDLCEKIGRFVAFQREIYLPWYEAIIKEILRK